MRARKHILRNSIHLFTEVKRLFFICMIGATVTCQAQKSYKRTLKLMGCRHGITVVASNETAANMYIDAAIAEISRIEKLISSWDSTSQTSAINRNAGIKPVKVNPELFQLIERAMGISNITDGAFDISYASMDRIWKFDGSMQRLPTQEDITASVQKVGYQNIVLNDEKETVFLKLKGMRIGFGAIGKGYAADRAKSLLIALGVSAGIINASGDMNTWGKQPDGTPWEVAITNPLHKSTSYGLLPTSEGAVVTSGDYEKFVEFNGKRYSHIIDPRTGMPARGTISVTVFAPKAELADALATALFVMGKDVGLNIINQMPKVETVIIDAYGRVFTSDNISIQKL
jgi:thiamine biosynthesis lipoprotein